jgi:hypothetical protein
MKKSRPAPKLRVAKETLRQLSDQQLSRIVAAGPMTYSRCYCN